MNKEHGDIEQTFRISFNCTPKEYEEFNLLKRKHNLKTNSIFTELFKKTLVKLRDTPSVLDGIDV